MLKKISLLLVLISNISYGYIKSEPVPGGVKKIPIKTKKRPVIYYNNHRIAVKKVKGGYEAIVGIPLGINITPQLLEQSYPYQHQYRFDIKNKKYKVQKLTIKNKRKVTPLSQDVKRIKNEKKDFHRTINYWSEQSPFDKPFVAPVRGYITSTYGLKRVYNGKPKSPHTALDIAASTGTPVVATAQGQVINIHNRFFTGNTIIIDHGQGVMSLYAHLNTVKVKNGQNVKQGDVIGTVGMTGRVTGPHLHWALYLNQTTVNPLLFIKREDILPLKQKAKNKPIKKQAAS